MDCHECAAIGMERTTTLCACDHHPERPYATTPDGVRGDADAMAGRQVRP